ncbi:hypothetical protein [Burkholderia sp. Ac-20379]|uniref:hypothetical protein n=1 Tax=Burkholderia sp. Ac-20379 TaxID=2703900 RepID=UPI00197D94E4|nr:hypothetical protein [Burkholderia sp. Ac-20379]MBN3728741.1 hypothetical protein [Burkholderia sp. Ac-20379]
MTQPRTASHAGLRDGSAAERPRPRASRINPWPGPADALPPRCPLCAGALEPVPGEPGRARHRSTRNSARCVLTTRRYQPDDLIVRGTGDAELAGRHRARFLERWEWHYTLARRIWPGLSFSRFATLVALADVDGLWAYPALREEDIAAVLLVTSGFMRTPRGGAMIAHAGLHAAGRGDAAQASPGDPDVRWCRFWFDASIRDAADLWRAPDVAPRLFLVRYREPALTPLPTGAQVSGWHRVEGVREAWRDMVAAPPSVSDHERAAFARFIALRDGAA